MSAYLDNSATTPICDEAIEKMVLSMSKNWGNPSSLHEKGISASKLLATSRKTIAKRLSCLDDEVYFTSGGTESNNLAILGAVDSAKRNQKRIVTTSTEHSSVEESMRHLETLGYEVIRLKVDNQGYIDERQLRQAITPSTALVSIILVNNEVGTIQPVEAARRAVKNAGSSALIHCDAVQAFGKMNVKPSALGVDMLTISSHKIHGPKGVGALYIKKGTKIHSRAFGGSQEKGIRPGTEPLPAIAGFAAAVEALPDLNTELSRIRELRDYFIAHIRTLGAIEVNSPPNALPFLINISVLGIPSEVMLNFLSDREIYISNGSACSKGKKSRVLTAMNLDPRTINSALRISLSRMTTKKDIDQLILGISAAKRSLKTKI